MIFWYSYTFKYRRFCRKGRWRISLGCWNGRDSDEYRGFWQTDYWACSWTSGQVWPTLCDDWLASNGSRDIHRGSGVLLARKTKNIQKLLPWARLVWTTTGWQHLKKCRNKFSVVRFSCLRNWTYLCSSHPWCARRYLWNYQKWRSRSLWRYHAFLLWFFGLGGEVRGAWYGYFLFWGGDFQEGDRYSGSGQRVTFG